MLVNVAEGVLVFSAPLGAGGRGNANRQQALVIAPYLLLQLRPTPPRGYFCTGGSTVVCAASVRWLALWSTPPAPEQAGPPTSRHGLP